MLIHLAKNQQKYGPYTLDDVRSLLATGEFTYTDLLWHEGLTEWVPIEQVVPRAAAAPSVPLPLPPPSPVNHLPPPPTYAPPPASSYGYPGAGVPGYSVPLAPVVTYAEFWKRFAAWLMDYCFMFVGTFVAVAFFATYANISDEQMDRVIDATITFIIFLGSWVYGAIFESSPKQATLGKMALGLIVTDMSGKRLSFARASGRHFAKYLSWMIFYVGYIMAAFTERKQGLHDIMAGALVLEKQR